VRDARQSAVATEQTRLRLPRSQLQATTITGRLLPMGTGELMGYADRGGLGEGAIDGLKRELMLLSRRITAELHQRGALALAGVLAILLGAVISINLQRTTPLVAYFWVFLLTLIATLVTFSGENTAGSSTGNLSLGLAVTWAGNALLVVVLVTGYMRLGRES
ncbi:MAG: hypothetical protein R3336_03495, partial [Phycisphaeraceae bacterium]|nr:hypothetical protein [Phycisphaeraceae bacterium]